MSLDVNLIGKEVERKCECSHCGHIHITTEGENLFSSNITSNLNIMASNAGIYRILWRADELGIQTASELIDPLKEGLAKLKSNPAHYKQFDAKNGWGTYDQFIPWIEEYLQACIDYPEARVFVSR